MLGSKKFILLGLGLAIIFLVYLVLLPRIAAYYTEQGRVLHNAQNFEEAQKKLEFSLKLNSRDPLAHAYLGSNYLGRRDPDGADYYPDADYSQAIAHCEKALASGLDKHEKQSVYRQTLERLTHSYRELKQYDKMAEIALRAIKSFPENSFWPRYFLAEHYFNRANKPQEALFALKDVVPTIQSNDPTKVRMLPHVSLLISRLYIYFEEFDKAKEYANLAISFSDPKNNKQDIQIAHNLLAIVAGSRGDFTLAREEIKKAEGSDVGSQQCVLAQSYFLGKNYSQAVATAQSVKVYANDYLKSICLAALAQVELAKDNSKAARMRMEEYMLVTDGMVNKNVFVTRYREQFAGLLRSSL